MIKLAVIGAGFMGSTHARAAAALADVRVAWIVSRSEERARRLAEELGCRWTTRVDEALADGSVDAVDVTYPTAVRRQLALAALKAGKHVLCEKPVAATLAEADEMARAATETGRVLMVAHVLRFWPEYREVLGRVRRGDVGRPVALHFERLTALPRWNRWMSDSTQTGGAVVDILVHDFDIANALAGDVPRAVLARGVRGPTGGRDYVQALVSYAGTEAAVEGGVLLPPSYLFSSIMRVVGEDGVFEYRFRAGGPSVEMGKAVNELVWFRGRAEDEKGQSEVVAVPQKDAYAAEIEYFFSCLRDGRPVEEGSPQQARLALAVALAAREAMERPWAPQEIHL